MPCGSSMAASASAGQAAPAGGSSCAHSAASDQVASTAGETPSTRIADMCSRRSPSRPRYSRQLSRFRVITAAAWASAERQPVQVRAQVEGLGPLVGKVGEPGAQVRQHLAAAEPADRRDPRSGREDGPGQGGGDDDLPGRARRPEVFQVSQADQVIEDQRPRAPGVRQPAGEAARGGLGGQRLIGRADRPGRLREAGDDRLPAGRRDPDQRVDRAGAPQRVAERHRDLGLAGASLGRGRGGGLLAVGQHHGVAWVQARPQVQPGFGALVEGFGERRDESGQLDRRVRTGPLPNHVDSLSRVAPAVRKAS